MQPQHKGLTWGGWGLTGLIAVGLTFSAVMKFVQPAEFADEWSKRLGYPLDLAMVIGGIELACVVIFLVPQTAVLGAILLTGYLGGAVATHVRIHDPFIGPVIGGVLVWLALFLREPRLRVLLPIVTARR